MVVKHNNIYTYYSMSLVEVLSLHLSVVAVLYAEDRSRIVRHYTVVCVRLVLKKKTETFYIVL